MNTTSKFLTGMAFAALPVAAFAGGYGDTAVRDATVGQSASAGNTVFCQRLDAEVPEALARDMDCDSASGSVVLVDGTPVGTATPRVLDDRVENDRPRDSDDSDFRKKRPSDDDPDSDDDPKSGEDPKTDDDKDKEKQL